ncbi:hypothetical protein Pint_11209 [Pistacia integerrima]|uniref:Uncharacterized protein n=1 Tax=Pistacia integerrima TaxID=434235 RepID=A0ACC0XJK7_9ROSI|nr:hypothetical protein Pint_11209 [Pistacia integerrima]
MPYKHWLSCTISDMPYKHCNLAELDSFLITLNAAAAASFIQYPPSKIELHEEKDELVAVPPQGQDDDRGINEDIKKLYRTALSNEWLTYDWDPDKISKYLTNSISENDNNALHIAAAADSHMVVRKLVKYTTKEDLAIQNGDGYTAFCLLAGSPWVGLAALMFDKNEKLPSIRGYDEMLPIHVAAQHGHKNMVKYLYEVSKDELTEKDRIELIRNLISRADLFALQLLKEHKELAIANLGYEWRRETALHILAGTPMMPPNLANQNQQGILKRYFNISVSDSDKLPAHEKLSPQTLELLHLLLKNVDYGDTWIDEVINVAVAQDNIELLSMIICHYPELICKVDGDTDTCGRIFCNAVWKRQKDIFKLLKKNVRPRFQRKLLQKVHQYKDDEGNNILHYAGMSPPSDKLDTISGVAFQLQQELLWFQVN